MMILKVSLFCVMLLSSICVIADDKPECGPAVDAADRLAPASDMDCDYTKTGLNGVLHKAFSEMSTKAEQNQEAGDRKAVVASVPADNEAGEFSSPQQLNSLKFSLLNKATLECPKGFVLDGERYLPVIKKAMKLELIYHCL
jgi:hypothetical protein